MDDKNWTFVDVPTTNRDNKQINPPIINKINSNQKNENVNSVEHTNSKKNSKTYKAPFIVALVIAIVAISISIVFGVSNYNKNIIINDLQVKVDSDNELLSSKTDDINSLNKKYSDLQSDYNTIKTNYDFYEEYAVCVNEKSEYYHHPDCVVFDDSYFWIYNYNAAEEKGYKPCPYCCK